VTVPRLLRDLTAEPMSYERHCDVHGPLPTAPRPELLMAHIKRSGLRGRGGAAFPLAAKLDSVRRSRGRSILVVNGCEGEPMSVKDRLLLSSLPHLVIDGALTAAGAIGADEILFAVDELNVRAGETLEWALSQRPELRRTRHPPEIVWVPSGYVSGQESALVNWINQGVAKPTSVPPRVTSHGVDRRPTLVSNPETLAHLGLIARHGGEWFAQRGSRDDPGSTLVTVSGAVRHPGVYEIEHGASLAAALGAAGGLAQPARAFLVGGYAGAWIDASLLAQVRLDRRELRHFGARLGPGVIVALPDAACPVAETARVAGWLADQSAGQCGPCVHGLAAIADELARLCEGTATPEALRRVLRWCELATGRGACAHPDGAASFVTSALQVFATDFLDHAHHGLCSDCERPPVLTVPGQLTGVS
jgi:NADH:ubiquinone oxidoreductase subunit F (NADH-binding)